MMDDDTQFAFRASEETVVSDCEAQKCAEKPESTSPLFRKEIDRDQLEIEESTERNSYSILDRLQHVTWAWVSIALAAGGVTEAIHTMPFTFEALNVTGDLFLILSILLFILTAIAMIIRFTARRGSFAASFRVSAESLFFSSIFVALGVTLTNIAQYGIPNTGQWLQYVFEIIFWAYAALAFFSSGAVYLYLWSTHQFQLSEMTPLWIFPAYPLLLVGPLAAAVINAISQSEHPLQIHAKAIAFIALELQGVGFVIALTVYNAFIVRLMTSGLPPPQRCPSLFVSVGPAGFTAASIITFGRLAHRILPNSEVAAFIQAVAYIFGAALWGLALWFFMLSVGGQWRSRGIDFDISFFAYIFPNSALISSTHAVGYAFGYYPLQVFACVLSVFLILAYVLIFGKTVYAVIQKKLLWPPQAA